MILFWNVVWVIACFAVVDTLTGVGHWLEDRYAHLGMGERWLRFIVRDNLIHHHRPGSILSGGYWGRNRVCVAIAAALAAVALALRITDWRVYLILALGSQSNQVHAWGHTQTPPRPVRWLQSLGILQSIRHHALHHRRPFGIRFCTYTEFMNPILDRIEIWRRLENGLELFGCFSKSGRPEREGV